MSRNRQFRRQLLHRLMYVATAGAIGSVLSLSATACVSTVEVPDDDGGGGAGASGGSSATAHGGHGGHGGSGGSTASAMGGSSSSSMQTETMCTVGLAAASADQCPTGIEAWEYLPNFTCATYIVSGPTFDEGTGECCYEVGEDASNCAAGRPYTVDGAFRTAPARALDGWCAEDAAQPRLEGMSAELREALAQGWTRDALMEHASVPSFSRFSLELMALGAPAELIAEAHRAALDEVRHAQLCFSLASAYAGRAVGPGRFDFEGAVMVDADLVKLAVSTFKEGCINETLAALQAAEQLERTDDPAIRSVLGTIAADEARHAELAWRTVAWAMAVGGTRVRDAIERAMAEARSILPDVDDDDALAAQLGKHGRLDSRSLRDTLERALDEVALPCARAMIAARKEEAALPQLLV